MKYSIIALDKQSRTKVWVAKNLNKETAIEYATENAISNNFDIYVQNTNNDFFLTKSGTEQFDSIKWNDE